MAIRVRPAAMRDYPAMNALFEEIHRFHVEALPDYFRMPDGPIHPREAIVALLDDPLVALLVAEVEGEVAGLVDVRIRSAPDAPLLVPHTFAVIDTIVVGQSHQRDGVGRALMAAAEAWARGQGVSEMRLGVWEFNSGAMAFYTALGYQTGMRRMFRRLDEEMHTDG
jgi:ribosomal protein S18 acetylase RimI-like enzyme